MNSKNLCHEKLKYNSILHMIRMKEENFQFNGEETKIDDSNENFVIGTIFSSARIQ
jgi:hypothetical protein